MDTSALEGLGLSPAEAKVYLALLESGPSKTGAIIKAVGLQSSTVYHVLDALIHKGMASFVRSGKMKIFRAAHPSSLLYFIDERRTKLKDLLPALEEKERIGKEQQGAQVYQGIKGVEAALQDVRSTMKPGELYHFFQLEPQKLRDPAIFRIFQKHHLLRSEKKINVRGLCPEAARKSVLQMFQSRTHAQIRYTSDITPVGTIVYKNKVAIFDFDAVPTAFVIESASIAHHFRRFHDEKWKKAQP